MISRIILIILDISHTLIRKPNSIIVLLYIQKLERKQSHFVYAFKNMELANNEPRRGLVITACNTTISFPEPAILGKETKALG